MEMQNLMGVAYAGEMALPAKIATAL